MPAALAVAGIVGSLYSAHKSANAAKDAAKIQAASTDKAQQFNERAYADQKQAMSPYMQAGNDSLARLMAQHWGTPLPPGTAPTSGNAAMLGNAAQMTTPRPAGAQFAPQLQATAPQGPPQSLAAMQAGGGPPQGPQGGGPTVKLRAPTGEVQDVPAHVADQLIARGAVRVG